MNSNRMSDQKEEWEDFWSGDDARAEPDGGDNHGHEHPHDEDQVVHGPPGHDLTYKEIHAFIYGLVPAMLAFLLFGESEFTAAIGIVALGIAAAYGLKKIPNRLVNRAVVREPAYFLAGIVVGVVSGGLLQYVFTMLGIV